jgi:ABC-type nitrate/sulfonate/bicarbonate transport system permease component
MKRNSFHSFGLGLLGIAGVAALWLWLSWNSSNPFFPPLRDMVPDAIAYWSSPSGKADILSTLGNLLRGLTFGVLGGIVVGLIVGQNRLLDLTLTPFFEFFRSIPKPALLPLAIALFGIGDDMKVFSIALGTAWPVLLNTMDGLRGIPELWTDTATVYGLTKPQRLAFVVLPALTPRILAGIEIALPLSLILAVTSEMMGTTAGIGSVILNAQYTYQVDLMWSGILLLGGIGALMTTIFLVLRYVLDASGIARAAWR